MATDNEQLVLSISADVRQIQRQLKGLVGQTQRDTKAIESAFGGIDKAASGAFSNVAANSNRAFTTAEQGARRYQNAMRASTVQTGNLAAQLNDIGVQLAGGQSPFLIALQQGTQINQALGSGVGARGAVSALAGAFTSLLNPVSLATIAIIGLGGEAIQYFTSLLSEGDKSEEMLKQQAQLIQQVADRWGDAVPALREYADEIKRTQELASLDEGVKIVNQKALDELKRSIVDTRDQMGALVSDLQLAGEETDVILGFQTAFEQFAAAAEDGSLKVDDVDRVQAALAAALNSTGIPAIAEFKSVFDALSASALGAASSIQKVQQQAAAAKLGPDNLPTLGTLTPLESVNGQLTGDSIAIQNARAEATKSQTQIAQEKAARASSRAGRSGGGRSGAISEAERERKAVADLIEQLEFEQSLIGMTDAERAKANALRRAGSAATDEQRAKIEQLVEATYAEREALKGNKEAMRELQAVGKEVLQGIVSDLRAGKSGADILANALDRVIDKLASSAINSLFSGFGGAAGKGGLLGGMIIPGILHSGGVAGKDGYGHGRAISTSAFAGAKRYHKGGIAGLMPGEVPAILQRGEVVIPRGGKASGGRETITVNLAADQSVIAETADQRIQTASGTIVQVAVQQSTQRVVPTMARYQNDKGGAGWR